MHLNNTMQLLHLVIAVKTLLCVSDSYTIRSSVSWAVTNDVVDEELDTHSDEAPAVLVDNIGIWKQAYPSSVYRDGSEKKPDQKSKSEDVSSASRVFSYRMEEVKAPSSVPTPPPHEDTARVARYMAHYSDWGHLATISTQEQVTYNTALQTLVAGCSNHYRYQQQQKKVSGSPPGKCFPNLFLEPHKH